MRLTSSASHYPHHFSVAVITAALLWCLPQLTLATVNLTPTDGCFLHAATTVHVTKPTCVVSVNNNADAAEIVAVTFENIDPDAVDFSGIGATFTQREQNSFTAELTVQGGTTEFTLSPWFALGSDYFFVALSDNQARGTIETNPVFDDVLAQVAAVNPPFITNSGDLIAGSDDSETLQDMFGAVQATLAGISAPMYPVPGNHDYGDALATYTSLFGEIDYSYDVGDTHFIALSTAGSASRGEISEAQLAWLETELQTTQAHTIIYFHHPLSVPSWGAATCCFVDSTKRNALADVIDHSGVDLLMVGHSQGYDYRFLTAADVSTIELGLYQLVTGGGGGNIAQPNGDYHYSLVHVTPEGITHEPVYEDDFGLAVDYENNRGTKSKATAIVENDSGKNLPFVRLRFRLAAVTTNFIISDEAGNYYTDYVQHAYTDYTVVYVAIPIGANSTQTITIQPATALHTDTTQTVTTDGLVSYESAPDNASTATALTAKPASADLTITDLVTTTTGLTWRQTTGQSPEQVSEVVAYAITDQLAYQAVDIFVDDSLWQRVVAKASGELEFTVTTSDTLEHAIRLVYLPYPAEQISILPNQVGDPQVRTFSDNGSVRGQWYALSAANSVIEPPYSIWQSNLTDDAANDIAVLARSDSAGAASFTLGLYTNDGTALAQNEIPTQPILGDLANTGYEQFIYYKPKQRYVRSQSYASDTQSFVTQRWLLPRTYRFKRLQLLAAADTDSANGTELAFFDTTRDRIIIMERLDSRLIVTGLYDLPRNSAITATTSGQIDNRSTRAWLVAYSTRHGVSHLIALQPNPLDSTLYVTHHKRFGRVTINQVLSEPIYVNRRDRIIVLADRQAITQYRPTGRGSFKREQIINSTLGINSDIALGTMTGNQFYPRAVVVAETTAPGRIEVWVISNSTQRWSKIGSWYGYGENFPGGVTLAEQ